MLGKETWATLFSVQSTRNQRPHDIPFSSLLFILPVYKQAHRLVDLGIQWGQVRLVKGKEAILPGKSNTLNEAIWKRT